MLATFTGALIDMGFKPRSPATASSTAGAVTKPSSTSSFPKGQA